jgi:6-pyruvoyltetrahydropterin/6-carboxytetrahydropterin synthase
MQTVTRKLEFDAAHRVLGHGGRCKHLHGHRYLVEVAVCSSYLDELGMVVDFSLLKDRVGKWIDDNLDHNIILNDKDPLLMAVQECKGNSSLIGQEATEAIFAGRAPYVMQGNPTAENLAGLLFWKAVNLLPTMLLVVSVVVWETPNCRAEYRPSQPQEGTCSS